MSIKYLLLIYFQISFILCLCTIEENHCSRCNPVTKLCVKCEKNIYVPDKNGGCENSHKCIMGENQCILCNENESLCTECEIGFFPDENGGCSYTDNCEISYRGECLECKEDFILIGEKNFYDEGEIKICKSKNFGDLKNCEEINKSKGICEKCKEGYYLNSGDKKCSTVENCYESTFEVCKKCNKKYYLDKKDSKCKNQTENFEHCQETLDGKTCSVCDDDYYFDEEEKCTNTKFCSKSENFKCNECINNYYLTEDGQSCSSVKNCYKADKETGICDWCSENFCLKKNEFKCLSDEGNDFKYCKIVTNECEKCENGYKLGEDGRCTKTNNCAESKNGNCIQCSEGYYLGLDGICINKEHCIYSTINGNCIECEDGYVWDNYNQICQITDNKFKNCRLTLEGVFCADCKKIFI